MLMKFKICLLGDVNSSFPSHFSKEVAHREVSHREGGWCGAPFVHSSGDLPAACRIMTQVQTWATCVSLSLGQCPCRKLLHFPAEWQRKQGSALWFGHVPFRDCGCRRQENQQREHPRLLPWGKLCLPAQGFPSLTPRLSVPHLPYSQETPVLGQPCHQPQCDTCHHQHPAHCLTRAGTSSSCGPQPSATHRKGWGAPFAHSHGELLAPCKNVMGHRLGLSYLSHRALTVLQLSSRGGHRSVPWSGNVPARASSCNTQEKPQRRSNHLPLPWAAPASLPSPPCPHSPSYLSASLGWCIRFYTHPGLAVSPATNILPAVTQPQRYQGQWQELVAACPDMTMTSPGLVHHCDMAIPPFQWEETNKQAKPQQLVMLKREIKQQFKEQQLGKG